MQYKIPFMQKIKKKIPGNTSYRLNTNVDYSRIS